jgi:hypothetical protein
MLPDVVWRPLLEAAAQSIVGAIGGYTFKEALSRYYRQTSFDGPMDLWMRGLRDKSIQDGDDIIVDGLISPFSQLFPGNPLGNTKRYNQLYEFKGRINKTDFQAMEFFAGSDAALRLPNLNGESVVGIYARFGFVGEGLVGVVPTSVLKKAIPSFFDPSFIGCRARISGVLARCPAQHGFVAQTIAAKAGIEIDMSGYKDIPYIQVNRIKLYTKADDKNISLLGSAWGVSERKGNQYAVKYGYFSDPTELAECNRGVLGSNILKSGSVFYDDLSAPSPEFTFMRNFINSS